MQIQFEGPYFCFVLLTDSSDCCSYGVSNAYILRIFHHVDLDRRCFESCVCRYSPARGRRFSDSLYCIPKRSCSESLKHLQDSVSVGTLMNFVLDLRICSRVESNSLKLYNRGRSRRIRIWQWYFWSILSQFLGSDLLVMNLTYLGRPGMVSFSLTMRSLVYIDFFAAVSFFLHSSFAFSVLVLRWALYYLDWSVLPVFLLSASLLA